MKLVRSLVLLWLLSVAWSAFALVAPAPQFFMGIGSPEGDVAYSSSDAVCSAAAPLRASGPYAPNQAETWTSVLVSNQVQSPSAGLCHINVTRTADGYTFDSPISWRKGNVSSCPANSTAVTGGCQCASGFDEAGGVCVAHTNACTSKTGNVGVLNWTEGYTRTSDEGDRAGVGPVVTPPASGTVCVAGCSVSLQLMGPGVQPYSSQQPNAQGLYRRSVDYPSLGLGAECTTGAGDAPAKTDTPAPDCPGSVGEVNGRTVCVGTAAKPVTTVPLGAAPAAPIAGNPAAGPKPATGDGSGSGSAGRTPSAGSGGAAGGGSAAGVGGKGGGAGGTASGTGATSSSLPGEQQAACGAPGQPVCAVKVDETGTPTSASFAEADQKIQDYKGQVSDARTAAAGTSDKGMFEPMKDLWQAPSIQGCQAFVMPAWTGVSVDPCPVADGMRAIMAYIWAAVALFCCFGWIKEVL